MKTEIESPNLELPVVNDGKNNNNNSSLHVNTDDKLPNKSQHDERDGSKTAPTNAATNGESPLVKLWRKRVHDFCESSAWMSFMGVLTIWTLYQGDIRQAGTHKEADLAFEVIISICFFLFAIEIFLQCFYKEGYLVIPTWEPENGESFRELWEKRLSIGSFYFWMDIVATFTLIFDMDWMLDSATQQALNGGGSQSAAGGNAARVGARVGRIIRLVRMVRLVRIGKLYKYALAILTNTKIEEEVDDTEASKVGTAMADLTNRRVIVLILLMLVIIPLLNANDPDVSLSLAVQLIHQLAQLNATDPTTYESGLLLAINITQAQLPVVAITFNDNYRFFYDKSLHDRLRDEEMIEYYYSSNGTTTDVIYDQREENVLSSLYSIYTTSFVIVLLIGGIYAFSNDVQSLVITPIEKLVALVKKIAQNPLGVEYKMLGEDEGFKDGMETTVLLTTITKIGGLMRVGFGEAGAAIIAKNLQESTNGKLNLLGSGTLIYSIFGFCDVRQFTDTTECLQEEVMLFVNRIAHILHSIVVQCSGAANKNIGDAFLLTWKIDEKATKEQKALLADQALLTFCKALIELARHQEFICNFSVAATGRLFKRFPDYKVRIGSGLHVGWAIEGAIGSNRKIDASYISPHVSTTEFLESSTKEYGVSLLLSEPFYRLLSPAASRFVRQVDRIRRSQDEGPMGLYTYDCDLSIDWNDPFRKRKKSVDLKGKLKNAARRASLMSNNDKAALKSAPINNNNNNNLAPIREMSERSGSVAGSTRSSILSGFRRKISKDNSSVDLKRGPMNAVTGGRRKSSFNQYSSVPLQEVDEENPDAEEAAAAERLAKAKSTPTITVPPYTQNIWVEDEDLIDLRHLISDNFRTVWSEGMDAFIIGDWEKAKEKFHETLRLSKKDGPSKRILEYMKEHHDTAPEDWMGYCDLGGGGGH